MGRITSILVVMQLLVCCTSALGVDRWATTFSPLNDGSRPVEFAWHQSTLGVSNVSTTAFAFNSLTDPCDAQVSEFISTTTTRLFGGTVARSNQAEIVALIHPLDDPSKQLNPSHQELDLIRATSLTMIPASGAMVPTSLESNSRLLNPTIAGMSSQGNEAFGLSRFH